MCSQANVRAGKVLRPPPRALPSVIVDTEKVLREADGSVKLVVVRPHTDGKVFAPGCASKPDGESREEPEEKNFLQNQFPQCIDWSDSRWKACLAAGGGSKRRFQYCSDNLGTIIYLRALQGHSGRNLIDPSLQDNVVNTWRSKFEQETDSILPAC